ncbi:MAG: PIN domain-containing protein [Microcystis aeruginosa K13-05]|uniref:PIN domain-containing protein n=5 Tax=Microcystis TaxID=1125 RepID=A0A841UI18_MICAE|nr:MULTISPECIES: PIN domain-containing protein [Microcystis]MCA2853838.1 PIN domain-containing protein [Microcystis sp. M065S1]MCZ8159614.1 PIN domain-containing protein [Microcystis sp. LE19-196.1B]MCZ8276413.1 PIN domain-containing protein [Microcystis sp. LE19-4.1E]MCZ8362742.1 PIN domain-containing protein [Microcystis sp. LE19-251.1A]NCR82196.1 PIN domain-containing protein [Microcystis aeruginosa K13-10]NCR86116.1 PIN domain-containing protein [Microcystis aeruginosa K13-05]TRT91686.1 
MKILIDTNIIIDNALEREPFWNASEQVLSLIEKGTIAGYISASTFSDLYYIIRKARGRDWTLTYLKQLITFCQIATVNQAAIIMAFTTNFQDFEDSIQYSTAVVNKLDAIITRNPQDFPIVTPRIITPEQLIAELTNSH